MSPDQFQKLFKTVKQKRIGSDKKMETAYHEAGHALIDLIHGFTPSLVTIIPVSDSAGHADNFWTNQGYYELDDYLLLNQNKEWQQEKLLEYHTILLMAGIIAESFYTGVYNWEGAINDFNEILNQFLSYGITDIPDLQSYWNKTFDLIKTNPEQLKTIAEDLYNKEILETDYFTKYKNHGKD